MENTAAPQAFYDAVAGAINTHDVSVIDSSIALADMLCGLLRTAGFSKEQLHQMMDIVWEQTQDNPNQVIVAEGE